jgi:CheY-like chemotaxis protein
MPTVLIVDDEKLFLSSVSEGIADALDGIGILTAGNGSEALDTVRRNAVDLVVTDLKMPVMDGFQFLTHVISEKPEISAIVMTAFGTAEIEKRVRKIGAIGYIEKPIDLQLLSDMIQDALAKRGGGFLRGINLSSFLQLLGIERKTCTLNIRQGQTVGVLVLQEGELVNARTGTKEGEEAAYEIISWPNPEIEMGTIVKKQARSINTSLDQLLLDAHQILDERIRDESLSPDRPKTSDGLTADTLQPPGPPAGQNSKEHIDMANVKDSLVAVMEIEGTVGAALADWKSGMCLGTIGGTPTYNLEIAAAGNTEVVRSKMKAMANLGIKESIEDILITLDTQFHLIRLIKNSPNLFFYVAIKKESGNLALARHKLSQIESSLTV